MTHNFFFFFLHGMRRNGVKILRPSDLFFFWRQKPYLGVSGELVSILLWAFLAVGKHGRALGYVVLYLFSFHTFSSTLYGKNRTFLLHLFPFSMFS